MDHKLPFFGGCACGSIRYECTGAPMLMFNCHCRDCQRASGGAFTPVVVLMPQTFTITKGSPRYYVTESEGGGHLHRGFCAQCGSRLFGKPDADRPFQFCAVTASSLDDPSWFVPQYSIFTEDVQPWHLVDPVAPSYKKHAL